MSTPALVQPSTDFSATAMAIAWQIYYLSNTPKGEPEVTADAVRKIYLKLKGLEKD